MCSLPAGAVAAGKQCLSFGLLHCHIPFLLLHTDSSDKFGYRSVSLPLQAGTQRQAFILSGELFLFKNTLGFPHGLRSPQPPE